MSKLNFPTPDLGNPATLTYTEAGITWTWNDTLGVWSSDAESGGSTKYLSRLNDDEAAGNLIFNGYTTHNDGINSASWFGNTSIYSKLQIADGSTGSCNNVYSQLAGGGPSGTATGDLTFFLADTQGDLASSDFELDGDVVGYKVNGSISKTHTDAHSCYGFQSGINKDRPNLYNFYTTGDAPNLFKGDILCGGGAENNDYLGIKGGIKISVSSNKQTNSKFEVYGAWRGNAGGNVAMVFSGATSDTDPTPVGRGDIQITDTGIAITGLTGGPLIVDAGADARLITSTEAITNASAVVQQLQPVKINGTRHGFTAAALQPLVPEAVTGTAGATEVTDTGTEPIYQGVDQRRLIPLLTKALQEALARIDQLEADHATLMNNNNGGGY